MPVTRSAKRLLSIPASLPPKNVSSTSNSKKKKSTNAETVITPVAGNVSHGGETSSALVPAVLSFSLIDAKNYLVAVDSRFQDLFNKMSCKPFDILERCHPFRELAISIIGQQISWRAARSITHRFLRLYDPTIPEDVADYAPTNGAVPFFPTPEQVSKTDIPTLRTVGLSGRKAEYVRDLAARFADGRLSAEKLMAADDEELAKMLIEVRGIGKWTVDMFAIFSMRRPDILPVGDLGIQRGLVRWFLALHSAAHPFGLSPEKLPGSNEPHNTAQDKDVLPVFGETLPSQGPEVAGERLTVGMAEDSENAENPIPTPFTPSIRKTLTKSVPNAVPLPEGLTVAILKSRLDGKKIKGAFLTPKEMEDLTECWKPYRSIGVYYMWALADVQK